MYIRFTFPLSRLDDLLSSDTVKISSKLIAGLIVLPGCLGRTWNLRSWDIDISASLFGDTCLTAFSCSKGADAMGLGLSALSGSGSRGEVVLMNSEDALLRKPGFSFKYPSLIGILLGG